MKTWLLGIAAILILCCAASYIFIPSNIVISKLNVVDCSVNEADRFLADGTRWASWWPSHNSQPVWYLQNRKDTTFEYNGYSYRLAQNFYNSIEVNISAKQSSFSSHIYILKYTNDSVAVEWLCQFTSSRNPIRRILQYRQATAIKNNMVAILGRLQTFLVNKENTYGVNIRQIISKDSTLISTYLITDSYPTVPQVYQLIATLKHHITEQGATANNVPMLNVRTLPGNRFQTLVAIPVNGMLKETSTIVNKRFVPWKTLVGDVKGGTYTVDRALEQMQIYVQDHNRNAMGIPFQLLITDRSREPDTLKWITRICQAVS